MAVPGFNLELAKALNTRPESRRHALAARPATPQPVRDLRGAARPCLGPAARDINPNGPVSGAMDYTALAIAGLACLVVLVIAFRALGMYERVLRAREDSAIEMQKLKSGWYTQMQRTKTEKTPKKKRDDQEDDEEDIDDLDMLIEAVRPYKSLVAGFAASRKVPIDVEALMEHDPKEKAKVQMWLESQASKAGNNVQIGTDAGWVLPAP